MRRILNMGGAGSSQPGVTPWRDDSMFVRQESHDGSMGQQAPAAPSDYGSGSSGGSRGRRGPGQGQGQPPYPAADRYEGAGVSPANSAYGHVKQRPSRSSPAERNRPAGVTAAATPYPSYGEVHQEPPEHSNPFVAAVLGSGSTRGGHFQHQPSPPPPPPPLSQVPPPQQRPAQAEQLYYDDIATADGPRTLPSRVRTGAGDGQPAWSDDGTKAMKRDSSFPNPFGSGQAAQTSPMPAAATPAPTGEAATAADAHYMLSRRASKGHADGGVQRFRSLKRAGSRSNHQHRDAPVAGNDSSLETFEHQRQYQQQQQYPGEEGVARLPRRRSSKSQTLPSHGSTDAELVQQEYLRQSQLQQQHALHQGQGQGYAPPDDVERPMNRYVDVLQPPSVQQKDSGAGMDKIKNKLFGGLNSRRKELQMDHQQGHSHSQRDAPGNGASFSLRPRSQDFGATAASAASAPQGAQGETKKEGWFGKRDKDKAAKASPAPGVVPTSEANVTSRIGWLCATQAQAWDWGYLLHLCDSLSHSEASSKEAARALRKEFKYGEEKPRMRAIKVWAVLCLNASDRFKLQVAQKRFLEVCEEMATSSKTPPAVKDMMFDVWSMLAYLFKSDVELQSITRSYNKIRPDGWPLDGRPLDPDHPVFNPASTSLYQPNQARPSDFQRVELAPGVRASPIPSSHEHDRLMRAPDGTMVNAPARGVGGGGDDGFAGINEARDYEWEMEQEREREREWEREREREREEAARNAREQCEDARRSAQLLAETLVNHGLHSEELAMLSARAQEAQDTILSLLPWVSAAAERSRDALVEQHRANAADGRPHIPVDKTRDEMLLDDVLDAHEKLSTASGMVEEARNKAREDDEERRVLDQSMREQRMDRSNLVQDPTTGQYYSLSQGEGAHHSSSTNAGAASVQAPPPPARRSQQQQQAAPLDVSRASTHVRAPSSTSHLSHTTAREGNIDDQALQQSRLTRGPRPLPSVDNLTSSFASGVPLHLQTSSSNGASAPPSSFSAPHASSAHGHANVAGANASPNKDDNESVILTPIEPSEKALGKRRAVSVDEDTLAVPNGLGQQGATLAAQAQAMQLSSSNMSSQTQTDERASSHGHSHNHSQSHSHSHEEALRARPPPAIPGAPPPVAACATGTVPLATPMNGADLPRQQGQGRAGVPDTTNNPFYDPAYKHHFPQYQQPPSQ